MPRVRSTVLIGPNGFSFRFDQSALALLQVKLTKVHEKLVKSTLTVWVTCCFVKPYLSHILPLTKVLTKSYHLGFHGGIFPGFSFKNTTMQSRSIIYFTVLQNSTSSSESKIFWAESLRTFSFYLWQPTNPLQTYYRTWL